MLHDIHLHTNLSLCALPEATADIYLEHAKNYNLRIIGFSDHFWDDKIPFAPDLKNNRTAGFYAPQNFEHVYSLKSKLPPSDSKLKILFGCETEVDKYGTIAILTETAKLFDYVLVPHGHTHMVDFTIPAEERETSEKHAKFLVKSFLSTVQNEKLRTFNSIIAHPFTAVCLKAGEIVKIHSFITDSEFENCFEAARDCGIPLEINASCCCIGKFGESVNVSPFVRMYKIAKRVGCKFTLGSDSHSIADREAYGDIPLLLEAFGIGESDFPDFLKL